jgi:hypothetical protein
MRLICGLSLALVVLPVVSFPVYAKADSVVLGVTESQVPTTFGPGKGIGDAVLVDTTTTIDRFGFDLSQAGGGNVNYFIYDETTSSLLLGPQTVAVSSAPKQFEYATGFSETLEAGDVYYFGVYGNGITSINLDPTAFVGDGLSIATSVPTSINFQGTTPGTAISGTLNVDGLPTNYASLRVFSNDPVGATTTPEPSSLVLMGTGILAAAGALRKRLMA